MLVQIIVIADVTFTEITFETSIKQIMKNVNSFSHTLLK